MPLKPTDWSVVIVGRWNRAILTPAGVAKRVFNLDDVKQVEVLVPLDGVSPYFVRHPHRKVVARTDETRLQITLEQFDYETLAYAMSCGVNAMASLPETPFSAAGFNVNYQCEGIAPAEARLLTADADKLLSQVELKIVARAVSRSFVFGEGKLNLTLASEENSFRLLSNFHRASTARPDLDNWLKTPVEDVHRVMDRILRVLDIDIEEPGHESNGE